MCKTYVHNNTCSFYIYTFSSVCALLLRELKYQVYHISPSVLLVSTCGKDDTPASKKEFLFCHLKRKKLNRTGSFFKLFTCYLAVAAPAQHKREHTDCQATSLYSSLLTSLELALALNFLFNYIINKYSYKCS